MIQRSTLRDKGIHMEKIKQLKMVEKKTIQEGIKTRGYKQSLTPYNERGRKFQREEFFLEKRKKIERRVKNNNKKKVKKRQKQSPRFCKKRDEKAK